MTETLAGIVARLDGLSHQERAELAHVVLLSLDAEESGVEAAWDRELDQRIARIRSGQANGTPAEEVFADWRRGRA